MVLFNHSTRELTAKIVYYGPGLCGKTTNLRELHERLDRGTTGRLLSLSTAQDRTIYFDLLPVELGNVKGYTVRFQLCTVPGQVFYNETRKLVLRGVDGIVFVVDSQWSMLSHDLESFQNLKENLREGGASLDDLPVVVQYNKRDLPGVLSVQALQESLGFTGYPFVEAVASEGRGVLETFKLVSKLAFVHLLKRLQRSPGLDAERLGPDWIAAGEEGTTAPLAGASADFLSLATAVDLPRKPPLSSQESPWPAVPAEEPPLAGEPGASAPPEPPAPPAREAGRAGVLTDEPLSVTESPFETTGSWPSAPPDGVFGEAVPTRHAPGPPPAEAGAAFLQQLPAAPPPAEAPAAPPGQPAPTALVVDFATGEEEAAVPQAVPGPSDVEIELPPDSEPRIAPLVASEAPPASPEAPVATRPSPELETRLSATEEALRSLAEQVEFLENGLPGSLAALAPLGDLDALREALERLRTETSDREGGLEARLGDLARQVEESSAGLRTEAEGLRVRLDGTDAALAERRDEAGRLRSDAEGAVEASRAASAGLAARIDALAEALEARRAEAEGHAARVETLHTAHDGARAEIDAIRADLAALRTDVDSARSAAAEAAGLRDEVEVLRRELAEAREDARTQVAASERGWRGELVRLQETLAAREGALAEARRSLEEATGRLDGLAEEAAATRRELEARVGTAEGTTRRLLSSLRSALADLEGGG